MTTIPGTFIISLDFELFWGMQDVTTKEAYGAHILGVRTAIPRMLELFTKYGIHASWATVGMLATADRTALEKAIPSVRPNYANHVFSSYEYIERGCVGIDEVSDPYHFGASLIEQIRATPGQEIACHTFSHYYCLEEGASIESFAEDLRTWQNVLDSRATLDAIVFPRNQVNAEYLRLCRELGVRAYRGTQDHWVYRAVSTVRQYQPLARVIRLVDTYFNVTGHHTYPLALARSSTPHNFAASRFFRPYSPRLALLDPLKVRRVMNGMTHAAERGEVFHLWWHPHNFGTYTEQNLAVLEQLLRHFALLRDAGRMQSCTMTEVAHQRS